MKCRSRPSIDSPCELEPLADGLCVLHSDSCEKDPALQAAELESKLVGPDWTLADCYIDDFDLPGREVGSVRFRGCTFRGDFIADQLSIGGPAIFENCKFQGRTSFQRSVVTSEGLAFSNCDFGLADFSASKFKAPVVFESCTFAGPFIANQCQFGALLLEATELDVGLRAAACAFLGDTSIRTLGFAGPVDFSRSRFGGTVSMRGVSARYADDVRHAIKFNEVSFADDVEIRKLEPAQSYELRLTDLVVDGSAEIHLVGLNLESTSFARTDLERFRLHHCDWPEVDGRSVCFDELESESDAVLEVEYRGLRRIHEQGGLLKESSDFYFREMEAQRRQLERPELSVHNVYRIVSDYGESYTRPLAGLAVTWCVLVVALALAGSTAGVEEAVRSAPTRALRIMSFGRPPEGQTVVDVVLVSAGRISSLLLAGFLVLALRRRFGRK